MRILLVTFSFLITYQQIKSINAVPSNKSNKDADVEITCAPCPSLELIKKLEKKKQKCKVEEFCEESCSFSECVYSCEGIWRKKCAGKNPEAEQVNEKNEGNEGDENNEDNGMNNAETIDEDNEIQAGKADAIVTENGDNHDMTEHDIDTNLTTLDTDVAKTQAETENNSGPIRLNTLAAAFAMITIGVTLY